MFYRLKNRAQNSWFDSRIRAILTTAAIDTEPSSLVVIVTMLCRSDVRKYLVAIKSLYPRIGHAEVIVIDDGTLSEADRTIIESHVKGVRIVPISSIDTGVCPDGGCWERLVFITDLISSRYVIQMDADTLTIGEIHDVTTCIHHNCSFTLGTDAGRVFSTVRAAAAFASRRKSSHISIVAEAALESYPNCAALRYVRGSAGFAAFAPKCFSRKKLEQFSTRMASLVGTRWAEWGTEQIASNFIVANSPNAVVLPYPAYSCFHDGLETEQSCFIHFMGTHRFRARRYEFLARKVVANLTDKI